jgi:proline utilization trans-activator
MTSALADACIQTSRNSLQLLAQLWIHGSIATFGYFDANYIFSSAIVLFISNFLHDNQEDQDFLETAWDLLRMMKSEGNVPAGEFLQRLTRLKSNIEELKLKQSKTDSTVPAVRNYTSGGQVTSIHGRAASSSGTLPSTVGTAAAATANYPSLNTGALDDPLLQGFLMQSDSQWSADILDSTEELPFLWMYDMDEFANSMDTNLQSTC